MSQTKKHSELIDILIDFGSNFNLLKDYDKSCEALKEAADKIEKIYYLGDHLNNRYCALNSKLIELRAEEVEDIEAIEDVRTRLDEIRDLICIY